jgi:hypothetical protein
MLNSYNIEIGSIYMGDVFRNIQNTTIINKSNIQNAFNKIQKEHDEETSKALVKVAEFIENSRDLKITIQGRTQIGYFNLIN